MTVKYVTMFVCDHCKMEMTSDEGWFMVLRDSEEWNFCSPDCIINEFRKAAEPAF